MTNRDVAQQIGDAFAAAQLEDEDERMREKRRAAMDALRGIPSGTKDEDLTPEQQRALNDYEDALAWFARRREPA